MPLCALTAGARSVAMKRARTCESVLEPIREPPRYASGDGELKMQEAQIVGGFLFPADQQPACAIDPGVSALDNPASGFAAACVAASKRPRPFWECGRCSGVARPLAAPAWHRILCRAQRCCFLRGVGCGRRTGMLSSVASTNFWSCTLAPATATPIGTPRPSVSTERLTPSLPRSVGFFPVFFPAQRRLGHRPVQTLPLPIDALQVVVLFQGQSPQFVEHAASAPTLESTHGSRCPSRTARASPSTGNRCAAHTEYP